MHLFLLFNVMLPSFLYWFMQKVLSSRPPTVSSQPTSKNELPERGKYSFELFGKQLKIPTWPIGLLIFLTVGMFGFIGYLIFPHVYPITTELEYIPGLFSTAAGEPSSLMMLMRSGSITLGLGLGIGVSKILGNKARKQAEEHLEKIEGQFPTALFQLGNKISGGTPAELALEQAAESTSDLEISGLFQYASRNVRDMGMTFEESLFNDKYGALKKYPSKMINTVMRAILESSEKGTKMASMAMMTISRYLDNIHKTQEDLNDLMEETTTTIQMLAYLLAPIVSGVPVGMSQTIISAMYKLSQSFTQAQQSLPDSAGGSTGTSFGGLISNLDTAISPEILQFVVGIYLIQLLFILSTFYMKIEHGENMTYRNMFIGKVLIVGMIFYSVTLVIISLLFGGIVANVA
jgi:hypothetical protein